jgi:hypothetical protein
LNFISN